MKPVTKVIDNILDDNDFKQLENLIFTQGSIIKWTWVPDIEGSNKLTATSGVVPYQERNQKLFYMVHKFYDKDGDGFMSDNTVENFIYQIVDKIRLCLEKHNIEVQDLQRMKGNLYPNTSKLYEHEMHIDYNMPNQGAILSLNTCDGYTKLCDNTKVESVANRLFLFDASKKHCSTTTTDTRARFNINFNWI